MQLVVYCGAQQKPTELIATVIQNLLAFQRLKINLQLIK